MAKLKKKSRKKFSSKPLSMKIKEAKEKKAAKLTSTKLIREAEGVHQLTVTILKQLVESNMKLKRVAIEKGLLDEFNIECTKSKEALMAINSFALEMASTIKRMRKSKNQIKEIETTFFDHTKLQSMADNASGELKSLTEKMVKLTELSEEKEGSSGPDKFSALDKLNDLSNGEGTDFRRELTVSDGSVSINIDEAEVIVKEKQVPEE